MKQTNILEENVEITQVTSGGNVKIHPVTKAGNVKYRDRDLQQELDGKILLNDEYKQNFNFIENQVVQTERLGGEEITSIDNSKPYFLMFGLVTPSSVVTTRIFNNYNGASARVGFGLDIGSDAKLRILTFVSGTSIVQYTNTDFLMQTNTKYDIALYLENKVLKLTINQKVVFNSALNCDFGVSNIAYPSGYTYSPQLYNRPLTPQEIQHNFSVLNNTPSINQLQVTNPTNQTSILSLGTDSEHVEMETGRTLEEEYFSIIEGMSQEYTSNGEPITINNGLKARLVGAEITGNTKRLDADGNECEAGTEGARLVSTEACISNNGIKYPFYQLDEEGNKKQISLHDNETLKLTSNGFVEYLNDKKIFTFNGSENWAIGNIETETEIRFVLNGLGLLYNSNSVDILKTTNYIPTSANTLKAGSISTWSSGGVMVHILKSSLSTPTVEGFKAYLSQNNLQILARIATPTTTHIPKEVNSPVLTDKSNVLSAGEAVSASEFKVKVPMNLAKTYGDRLTQLESIITTPSNTQLLANYADDEYNKIINNEEVI